VGALWPHRSAIRLGHVNTVINDRQHGLPSANPDRPPRLGDVARRHTDEASASKPGSNRSLSSPANYSSGGQCYVSLAARLLCFGRSRSALLVETHTAFDTRTASRAERPRPTPPYRGVSIKLQEDSCAGARQIAGKRFLACAAPLLPIDNCDSSTCRCRYARFDDRRQDQGRGWNAISRALLLVPRLMIAAAAATAEDRRSP